MPHAVLCEMAASITELKANPMKVVASGKGHPIVVLNRNEPTFYCVPAKVYEAMIALLDDAELLQLVQQRQAEASILVTLDEL